MAFHGRRFDLASGTILFTVGQRVNPSLDIDVRLTVSEYTVDVLVTGVASKPTLKLQSSPQLAQADILSLIIFGRTSSALGKAERTSLRQQSATMAAGAAPATVGRELSQSLALESSALISAESARAVMKSASAITLRVTFTFPRLRM